MFKGKGQVKKESAQQALLKGPAAISDAASSPPSFLRRRKGAIAVHPSEEEQEHSQQLAEAMGFKKTQRPKEKDNTEEASLC